MALIGGLIGASWISELRFEDLQRLRQAARRAYAIATKRKNRPARHLTDKDADKWIEALGPKVAEQRIKRLVDQGM